MITVIVGIQWGDEGKGKIIDVLSKDYDAVVRFQGGNNAGHTINIVDKKFVLHIIPSGIVRERILCILGNGVVIEPASLKNEIEILSNLGINFNDRFQISSKSHLTFNYHKIIDRILENRLVSNDIIGTTMRGIGPTYADKISRRGIRAFYLLEYDNLVIKFLKNVEYYSDIFKIKLDVKKELQSLKMISKFLSPFITDTTISINSLIKKNKNILFEGAQGSLLDIDHGTYPYVTSSNTISGGVCVGSGISPKFIDEIIGITKAYCTRVGSGPFPTQLYGDDEKIMRKYGGEYGTTTGRDRRCGWFDAVANKYSCLLNGIEKLIITKLDILDYYEYIKVCIGYEINDKKIYTFPDNIEDLRLAKPIYKVFSGWNTSTKNARSISDLPLNAIKYINYISKLLDVKLYMVSVGSERSEIIFV